MSKKKALPKVNLRLEFKDKSIGPCNLSPWRKSTALTLRVNNEECVLAYFRNQECVDAFNNFMKELMEASDAARMG